LLVEAIAAFEVELLDQMDLLRIALGQASLTVCSLSCRICTILLQTMLESDSLHDEQQSMHAHVHFRDREARR